MTRDPRLTDAVVEARKAALIEQELADKPALFAYFDEQLSWCDLTDPYDAKLAALLSLAQIDRSTAGEDAGLFERVGEILALHDETGEHPAFGPFPVEIEAVDLRSLLRLARAAKQLRPVEKS
jgi:hypothetical protein